MLSNLDTLPRNGRLLFWADFIELRTLVHPDRCFTRGEFHGIYSRDDEHINDGEEDNLKKTEKIESKWRDIINFIENRLVTFAGSYPFTLSEDKDTVFLDGDVNIFAKQIYIALLISSLLRCVEQSRWSNITRTFEKICFEVFGTLMPEGSEIRATWAGGGSEAPYHGNLYSKMQAVASDIRCTANFVEQDFHINDTGDGGIDLIAWHPMYDEREGMPISFAQCGCSQTDWSFKQLEASPAKHRRHFPVMHLWSTYYFLPLDLRRIDGDWEYKSDIGEAIIVDRQRLVKLITENNMEAQMPSMPFIQEALEAEFL